MENNIKKIIDRKSGILLHFTSLPGKSGIGDLGPAAFDFIDFLFETGQSYWQFLPIGPGDMVFGCSPYMSLAALAGNPLLISEQVLFDDGLLTIDDLESNPDFSEYYVEFDRVIPYKKNILNRAFSTFKEQGFSYEFIEFCRNEEWLDDYALFMSIRENHGPCSWNEWPHELAARENAALEKCRKKMATSIDYFKFEQFVFFKQWRKMHEYATQKGIQLIGDLPIYVSYDSVDVWANQECFYLGNETRAPKCVAGVPPDYFSETGQRWGNPLYRWKNGTRKNEAVYDWWRVRFGLVRRLYDLVRIDHFRGFESYWEIPANETTAINGRWVKGPGKGFFKEMEGVIGDMPIIAEDLGIITPAVEKLRDELGFPGMKILQFAFDSDPNNLYLPQNYLDTNCVVYTGTHDNNTTLGWYLGDEGSEENKAQARRYANSNGEQIHWDFIRISFSSIASTAIIPLQDVLGFGEDCRMNTPSTVNNNWAWRCAPRFINDDIGRRLLDETEFYGRSRSK